MAAIDPPAGCRFLDLGAGRGALTAPALDRGCVVTAVDAAPAMCERLAVAYPAAEATSLGRRLNDLFAEFAAHLPPGGSMGHLIDAAGLLEDAGFVDLREKHAAVAIPFPDNATLWRWAMSHGYRAFVENLPDEHRREFHQRVMELPLDDRILRRETGIWFGRKPA